VVKLLGQVVTELVDAVDTALYIGELRVGRARSACFVFKMPEIKVGAMLAGHQVEPIC
jgi:hypothetical protein